MIGEIIRLVKHLKCFSVFFLFFVLMLVVPFPAQAASDLEILKPYAGMCKAFQNDSKVIAMFAPVRKLTDAEIEKGKWTYAFENGERSYPNHRVILPDGGVKRIFLVTIIHEQEIQSDPTYQWHVIAVPRVPNPEKAYDGFWAESKRCVDRVINRDDWLRLLDLSSVAGNPVHNLATETSKRAEVNQKWREIFGDKIINDLVIESARNRRDFGISGESYDYTFYFAPVPSLNQIQPEGFRWVSSRLVTRPGTAFGLILNAEGQCIESTEVEVVPVR
jgi:hypothetical protein